MGRRKIWYSYNDNVFLFFNNGHCTSSDSSDLPDMTDECIELSLMYNLVTGETSKFADSQRCGSL